MRWKVRGGMFYRSEDGRRQYAEGCVFDATEEEVAHLRHTIEPVVESLPEPPSEPPPRRRGRPPKHRVAYDAPPADRGM